jgi:guanine nucleotide-binding protein G(i) subunit alpha
MAEALAIIGGAASVVSIIDVLARSIDSIRELRSEWKDADFTVLNLLTQLTAFKAALTKIQEWMDSEMAEPHHQLRMDLDDSVTWCRILAEMVDKLLSDLEHQPNEPLDKIAKARLLFGSKSMEHLQKMIERQTNALTLLLTACNL